MADATDCLGILNEQKKNLARIIESLDESLDQALKLVRGTRGAVYVAGAGKSRPAAEKIASSLRTAGRTALFLDLHGAEPAETAPISHRDLVIVVSPTGESADLIRLLPALRKKKVKVIAITSSPRSGIARFSDLVVRTKLPSDLADSMIAFSPTLCALIAGETIAMTLIRDAVSGARGAPPVIEPPDAAFTVADIIAVRPRNPVAAKSVIVKDSLLELTSKGLGAISIVDDDGRLAGIITDGDVRRLLQRSQGSLTRLFLTSADKVMTPNPKRISPEKNVFDALELMESAAITVLPVVDSDNRPVGMIHLHDLVQVGLLRKKLKKSPGNARRKK
ncbi:MAG: CBS domain-containing protein [bacterium]